MFHKNRLDDPRAKVIPVAVWEEFAFYEKGLTDVAKALMATPDNDLLAEVANLEVSNQQEAKRLWMSIALTHPSISDEELNQLAKSLNLTGISILTVAIALGRESYFDMALKNFPTVHAGIIAEGLK